MNLSQIILFDSPEALIIIRCIAIAMYFLVAINSYTRMVKWGAYLSGFWIAYLMFTDIARPVTLYFLMGYAIQIVFLWGVMFGIERVTRLKRRLSTMAKDPL